MYSKIAKYKAQIDALQDKVKFKETAEKELASKSKKLDRYKHKAAGLKSSLTESQTSQLAEISSIHEKLTRYQKIN